MSGAAFRALLGTLLLIAPAGCAVDEAAEMRTYRAILDAGAARAELDASEPLGVLDAMRLANERNETLDIEGERYLQAVIDVRRAVANFLPSITLAPSYIFRDSVEGMRSTAFDVPVGLNMAVSPVRDLATVRASEARIEVRRGDLYTVQDALLLDVARVHAEILAFEKAVEVLSNSLVVQEARVQDARGRFESGFLRPLDVRSVEAQAAQTSVLLTEARTRVATGRALLGFLIGMDVSDRPLDTRFDMPDDPLDVEELTAIALERRPERLAAGAAIAAAQEIVEAAYGQYYPTISLDLVAFLSRQSAPENLDWTGLISLSLPLFSAGLIEADVRTALSFLRQSRFEDARLARAIERDVIVALENLRGAETRIEQLRFQVEAAGDALAQADGLFTVGLATNLERIDAQARFLDAELEAVRAELDRVVFWFDLLRVTGRLNEAIDLERDPAVWPSESDPKGVSRAETR